MFFPLRQKNEKNQSVKITTKLTTQETPSMAMSMVSMDPLAVGQRVHELEDHEAPDAPWLQWSGSTARD